MTSTESYIIRNTSLFVNNVNDFNLSTANTFISQNTSECSNQFPSTEDLLRNASDLDISLGVTCLVMTILLVILYVEEVAMLKLTYTDKDERQKVMCLLGIYPVFSLCAMCGLVVPRSWAMTEFMSTIYLSMAMFIFQRMIVLFFDGESNLVRVFNGSHLPLAVPPLCCICPCICKIIRLKVSTKTVITVRLFVIQGALIRPIISFIYGVYFLNTADQASDQSLVSTLMILKGLSMMLAMFGLQIIYRLTRSHLEKDLGQNRILGKFTCFQMVIVFGILQPNIFNFLQLRHIPRCSPPYGSLVLSIRYNNIVQIFEMFVIAIVARFIYHPQNPDKTQPNLREEDFHSNQKAKCYAAENPALIVSTDALPQEKNLEEKT